MNCVSTSSHTCSLSEFSYKSGGALTFDAYDRYTYGGPDSGSGWEQYTHRYVAGSHFSSTEESSWTQSGVSGDTNYFTPETRFSISAMPDHAPLNRPYPLTVTGAFGRVSVSTVPRSRAGITDRAPPR